DVPLRVVRRVHLDVVAAERDDLADDVLAQVVGDRAQEVLRRRVDRAGMLAMPENPMPAGRRNRELRAGARMGFEERVLVRDDVPHDRELSRYERARRGGPHLRALSVGFLLARPTAWISGQDLLPSEQRV